ncbi:MAG TPA: hypothetical protein DCP63_03405 [Bacteroidetes bacterium]|nr:hypothetical protein [Bacteroidota bacterium]
MEVGYVFQKSQQGNCPMSNAQQRMTKYFNHLKCAAHSDVHHGKLDLDIVFPRAPELFFLSDNCARLRNPISSCGCNARYRVSYKLPLFFNSSLACRSLCRDGRTTLEMSRVE